MSLNVRALIWIWENVSEWNVKSWYLRMTARSTSPVTADTKRAIALSTLDSYRSTGARVYIYIYISLHCRRLCARTYVRNAMRNVKVPALERRRDTGGEERRAIKRECEWMRSAWLGPLEATDFSALPAGAAERPAKIHPSPRASERDGEQPARSLSLRLIISPWQRSLSPSRSPLSLCTLSLSLSRFLAYSPESRCARARVGLWLATCALYSLQGGRGIPPLSLSHASSPGARTRRTRVPRCSATSYSLGRSCVAETCDFPSAFILYRDNEETGG